MRRAVGIQLAQHLVVPAGKRGVAAAQRRAAGGELLVEAPLERQLGVEVVDAEGHVALGQHRFGHR